MAIVKFTFSKEHVPSNAQNLREKVERYTTMEGEEKERTMWLWNEHVGMCLEERERNMRDDSDFYMLVWLPEENRAEWKMFATTRGWTYPALGSWVDASDEVREQYKVWKAQKDEELRLEREKWQKEQDDKLANYMGISYDKLKKLEVAVGKENLELYKSLLKTGNKGAFRSNFRKSLFEQVMKWLDDPSPKFNRPLSYKQQNYL